MFKALCLCCAVLVGCGGKLAGVEEMNASAVVVDSDDGGVVVEQTDAGADVASNDETPVSDCVSNPNQGNCDCWPTCSQLPIEFNGQSGHGHTFQ